MEDSWMNPKLELNECVTAVRLWSLQVEQLGKKPFEFLAQDTPGKTRLTWQYTPVKFAYQSCTLAIVMPHDLDPSDLDLPPDSRFPGTDIASFFDLKLAAKAVLTECVKAKGRPKGGWWSIGGDGAVGLFIWATGSEMDEKVHGFQMTVGNHVVRLAGAGFTDIS
ncbi:MAG: hypothetical protein Q9209_004673 [Squamulea sp. 1 TL-2023]